MENAYPYLVQKLFILKDYINKLEKAMQHSIDVNQQKNELYLINKDIIGFYLNSEIYKKVANYYDNNIQNIQGNNNLSFFINDFLSKERGILKNDIIYEDYELVKNFAEPEKLMIKNVEFYNNFFIVDANFLQQFFGNAGGRADCVKISAELKIFNKKTFIGNEGIFIVNSKTMDNQNEPKTYIYFIKSMNKISLDEFRINKIYIFNKIPEFINEFNNCMKGKSAESYFACRNFLNKGGIFNIIKKKKKIGLYIHIDRIEKYQDEEDSDENRPYLNKFLNFNY